MQESARRLALRIAKHRDDDVRAEAMNRVRRRQIGLRFDLGTLDHLVQARAPGIGRTVDNVQVGAAHSRHDQIASFLARIVVTRRTGVPAHVMQLVADAGHLEPTDNLAVGRALRVGVDGGQIVRFLDARADVERDGVEEPLAWRLHRLRRRRIAWAAAGLVRLGGHAFLGYALPCRQARHTFATAC